MKSIDEHIDLIERYLYDDLTQEELEEFNDLLKEDAEFNKLFYEMDHLLDGIRRSAKKTTVEEKLARLEEALPLSKVSDERISHPVEIFIKTYKAAIAASLSLLIVSAIILTNLNSNYSSDELFDQYFKVYDSGGGVERGKSDLEKLQVAKIEYEKGNYEMAVNIFEQIDITEENRIEIWLHAGNAYLKLNDVNKAIDNFKSIINAKSGFEEYAKWYLSLCYLKNDDLEHARPLLQEIKESGRGKYMEADEILSKLK
jgi:tetratricopeptide (TPR) repeat protein